MRADWINGGLLLVAVLASCFAVLWQSDRGVEPPQVVSLVGSEDPPSSGLLMPVVER